MLNLFIFLKHESFDLTKVFQNEHQEMVDLSSDEFILKHIGKWFEHAFRSNGSTWSNVFLDENSQKLLEISLISFKDLPNSFFI